MNKRLVLFGLAALLTAGTAASLPAIAQAAGAADFILIRQAGMSLQSGTFGGLKNAIDAKVDVKTLAGRADAMTKFGKVIPLVFPAGSDTGNPTKALPTIWSDRAGFEKAAANLVEAAEKLSVLAKAGDADGFAAQWKVTGESCNACHKDYRSK
jgi:cytochrome c556